MIYINTDKLDKINLNKNNVYIAIDFDKTITSVESIDSWDATGNILGKEFKKELGDLYEEYGPIERSYSIDFKEKEIAMEEWYSKCMGLYYKYGLTNKKLIKSIDESEMIFREGAKEFLQDMNSKNIPVIILSAGIGNVIERFLKTNNCYFDNVYIISNFIEFDNDGKMREFEDCKMIHSLNKTMKNHLPKEIEENLNKKRYKILFGDLIEDKKMVEEKDLKNTITVCFLNKNTEVDLNKFNVNFDIVLSENDANFKIAEKIVFN